MLAGAITAVLCTAAPLAALAGSAHPQLYLSPPPPRLAPSAPATGSSTHRRLELDAPQTNAVLASHLGVSHHLPLPASKGKDGRDWEAALDDSPWAHDPHHARIVVVLECPKSGCDDALPADLATGPVLDLAPLPAHSYLAALSLHLHRLTDTLGLDPDSPAVQGLQDLVDTGIKSVAGWQGWIGDELARWVGYHGDTSNGRTNKVRPAVEPPARGSGIVDDLDLLDASSNQLVLELNKLAALADGVPTSGSRAHAGSDSGPQGANDVPKVVVIHLKGLKDIAAKHSLSSPTYQRAVALTRDTLTGTLASLRARLSSSHNAAAASSDEPTVMLLALPPHAQPLLRKRDMWLKPFEGRSIAAATKRYAGSRAEAVGGQQLKKRSVFSQRAASGDRDGEGEGEGDKAPSQVVAAGKTCFSSLAHLNNATASCLGRGHGVRGISTQANADGAECWVCKCGVTEDDEGRRTSWAGEGCEKKDLSGSALLLALTTLGLALAIAGSVALLYNIGSVPLPGTLSAVSGMGPGGAKRD
ncbi:hypothetical protein JCM9279_000843 [Rhodotorula babjevae]